PPYPYTTLFRSHQPGGPVAPAVQHRRAERIERTVDMGAPRRRDMAEPRRHAPLRSRVPAQPRRIRIEAYRIEVRPDIVRVRTVEGGGLDPHLPREAAEGHDSERRVGEVLGVMPQRRGRIVHGRGAMRLGYRTEGRFPHRGRV